MHLYRPPVLDELPELCVIPAAPSDCLFCADTLLGNSE
jgi:hypothetical protein